MTLFFAIEASQPNGAVFRLALGFFPASWFTAFRRLF
jgi:hypothetical protein